MDRRRSIRFLMTRGLNAIYVELFCHEVTDPKVQRGNVTLTFTFVEAAAPLFVFQI